MGRLKIFWIKLKHKLIKALGGFDTPMLLVQENYRVDTYRSSILVDKRAPEDLVINDLYRKLAQGLQENNIGIVESEDDDLYGVGNKKYVLTIYVVNRK